MIDWAGRRRLRAVLLPVAAAIAVAGGLAALIASPRDDRPDQVAPPVIDAGWPLRLHSEQPGSSSSDVSRAFVDVRGRKLVLNGFNIFPLWPNPPRIAFDEKHYREIKAKGYNAVRFVLPWAIYEPRRNEFRHLEELDRAVAYARRAGLYVVLLNIVVDNWNHPPAWATEADKITAIERHAEGWTRTLAKRYRNDATVAAYDLAAELPSTNQNRLLAVYSKMIGWVRSEDPDKIVIATAGWGNSAMSPKFASPSSLRHRHNVVFAWHDYYAGDGDSRRAFDGYDLETGQNAGNQVWDGRSGYPSGREEADFEAQIQAQVRWARRANLPIWVAEYGINPDSENASAWIRQKTRLYDRLGLSRMWWLYDCKDGEMAPRTGSCEWKSPIEGLRP